MPTANTMVDGPVHAQVMGVLNVTPDSFSDGGRYLGLDAALAHARQMVAEGATLIDVGGESTRPGAVPVPVEEELARVVPVIAAIAVELNVDIAVDTSQPEVMRQAVHAGASMINDIRALQLPGALDAASGLGVRVCLMHMRGSPQTMQDAPHYTDIVAEVRAFLVARVEACLAAGIPRHRLLTDPGFGFGKTLDDNLALLRRLDAVVDIGPPVLVGMSRKSMLGTLLGRPVGERLHGGIAAAVLAVTKGARIVRTHDVRATSDALKVVDAVLYPATGVEA